MKFELKVLTLAAGFFLGCHTNAQELSSESEPTSVADVSSRQSNNMDMFWISVNAGLSRGGSGDLIPTSPRMDISARVQFNRWVGLLINHHDVWVDAVPRHGTATAHNSIWALGPAIVVAQFGKHNRFWHNSYVLVHALWQHGNTHYRMAAPDTNDHSVTLAEGSQSGEGYAVGGDLFLPIFFGTWANAGLGFETNNFNYPSAYEPRGDTLDLPATLPYIRVGIAYSF